MGQHMGHCTCTLHFDKKWHWVTIIASHNPSIGKPIEKSIDCLQAQITV